MSVFPMETRVYFLDFFFHFSAVPFEMLSVSY